MRGIVTLAAAYALPEGFPYRDLILLTAFAVVLGSLVIQGLTLRPLISALKLRDENPVASEVARARAVAYRAALNEIDGDPSEEAEILRLEYARAAARGRRPRWRRRDRRTSGRSAAAARDRRRTAIAPRPAPVRNHRRRRLSSARGGIRLGGIERAGVMFLVVPANAGSHTPCRLV
jgi:hypothetical protein